MSLPFYIANKFVHSKRDSKFLSFVSVISITGIALGVTILIIALTILNGFQQTIKNKIIDFNSHITVSGFGNRNLPNNPSYIDSIYKVLSPYAHSISPYLSKNAIIKSKYNTEGIMIKGISLKKDNSYIKKFIIEGKYSLKYSANFPSIIIGKKLADKLFLNVGDIVTLFTLRNDKPPSIENPPSIEQFKVRGIYQSGMAEYDDLIAYINLKVAQEFLDLPNKISGYNIQLNNLSHLNSLADKLQNYLGYPYYVRTFYQTHQQIFTWLALQKKPIPIILGLIILVAAFNIVGTLLMLVLERTNSIGVLRALGASKFSVIKIFIIQGIYLSLLGILTGNLLAFILSYIQKTYKIISLPASIYYISSVPISIDWRIYVIVTFIAFILCVIGAFIPSFIAAKINPIQSIRFD